MSGVLCPLPDLMDGTRSVARQRMQIRRRDGKIVWVETNYTPIRDASGTTIADVGVMRNVTEDVQRNRELRGVVDQNIDMNISHTTSGAGESTPPSSDGVDFGGTTPGESSLDQVLTTIERREIVAALRRARGQRTEAARRLGISRSRLYRRMEALGIDPRTIETGEGE